MSIVTMMFMSLTVSSLFSMMRRNGAVVDGRGDGGGRSLTSRGLSWMVVDSLPLKRYEAMPTTVTEDGDAVEDVLLSRENSRDNDTTERIFGIRPHVSCHATKMLYRKFEHYTWFLDLTMCALCHQHIGDTFLSEEVGEG